MRITVKVSSVATGPFTNVLAVTPRTMIRTIIIQMPNVDLKNALANDRSGSRRKRSGRAIPRN